MTPSFHTKMSVLVECKCGWSPKGDGGNGIGLAAQHFKRCRQYIRAEATTVFVWDPEKPRPDWKEGK